MTFTIKISLLKPVLKADKYINLIRNCGAFYMIVASASDKLISAFCYEPTHVKGPSYGTAWVGHINFAYYLISELQPNTVVELGTHGGASYFAFCDSIKLNNLKTKSYAIDTWQGEEHAGKYKNNVYEFVSAVNQNNFSEFSLLLRSTFEDAAERFSKNSIDMLHIDGFHSYEAVSLDYNTYIEKVSDSGIVLFHDTHEKRKGFGVHRFWSELKNTYPEQCFEFAHSHGLGIFFKSKLGMNKHESLVLSLKNKDITNIFQKLGMCLYEEYNGTMAKKPPKLSRSTKIGFSIKKRLALFPRLEKLFSE